MAYITQDYYNVNFSGESVDNADFPKLLVRASEIIEEMSLYRISESKMNSFSSDVQEKIKQAICAQIEYLDANGGSDLDMGSSFQSATLGKFNYSKATNSNGTVQELFAPRAMRCLLPTGLLYRGGGY